MSLQRRFCSYCGQSYKKGEKSINYIPPLTNLVPSVPQFFQFRRGSEIETALALKISERRSQASPGREPEVETAIAFREIESGLSS